MSSTNMLVIPVHLEVQPGGICPEIHLKKNVGSAELHLLLPYDEGLSSATQKTCVIQGILPDRSELFLQDSTRGLSGSVYVRLYYHKVRAMAAAAGRYKCTLTILDTADSVTRENYMDCDFLTVLPFTVIVHDCA